MKSDSGEFTHRRFATPPEDFRALATGSGQSMEMSEDSGEVRRARVMANPSKLSKAGIRSAPEAEGWGTLPEDRAEVAEGLMRQSTTHGPWSGDEPPEPAHPWRRGC